MLRARLPLADDVERVDFSPDGSTAYTAGQDVVLRHWDLGRRPGASSRRWRAPAIPEFWGRVVVAPGGDRVAYQAALRRAGSSMSAPASSAGAWTARTGSIGRQREPGIPAESGIALPTGDQVTVWDAAYRRGRQQRSTSRSRRERDRLQHRRQQDGDSSTSRVLSRWSTRRPSSPSARRCKLGDVPCAVSLGPDNRTAFVSTGEPKADWAFWSVRCSGWALVDLESGSVLDRGSMDSVGGDVGLIDFSPRGDRVALEVSPGLTRVGPATQAA